MDVKRREPIAVVEYVLRKLERQAIDIGSHPVLIHEGLEALDRLREENARLRQRVAELEIAESAMNNLAAKLTATEAKLARCVEVAKSSPLVSYTPVDGEAIRVVPVSVVLAASSVVVPGVLDGDIAPAIRQLTRERAEARAEAKHLKECNDGHPTMCCGQCASQIKEAKAEVARSHDAILHLTREVERLEGLILDWDGLVGSWQSDMKAEARRIRGEGRDGKA